MYAIADREVTPQAGDPEVIFCVEVQFTALRYFALDGTDDHASHKDQASMIRRYIIWRNNHAYDERLRPIIDRVNVA